ncbi:MAG TPA: zf-HC2 domain-containing protein [Verrucomicrobiae bacterium]|nr:zf-HC2 domain-containing protein [Verrucomicrobiae bacterium]
MIHPRPEEWMSYLYGELPREEKARFQAHLNGCANCRTDVTRWQGAMKSLDQWQIAAPRRAPARFWEPALKWGIAAALALGIGFGAGRYILPASTNAAALRASLKSELHAELLADLKQQQVRLEEYKKTAEEARQGDNRLIFAAINKAAADHQAELASFRKDLETVAVRTEYNLGLAQQQIVTLANYTQNKPRP